ncbi:unnamed protein product [Nezara viridula]|uniref:Uncharacterized protein n=1 Tax=Nezara viridula TaxID=85310 RepID=A0A9P0MPS4_NEZVI|nr:unnamed protein product [Nezara viridula]
MGDTYTQSTLQTLLHPHSDPERCPRAPTGYQGKAHSASRKIHHSAANAPKPQAQPHLLVTGTKEISVQQQSSVPGPISERWAISILTNPVTA